MGAVEKDVLLILYIMSITQKYLYKSSQKEKGMICMSASRETISHPQLQNSKYGD